MSDDLNHSNGLFVSCRRPRAPSFSFYSMTISSRSVLATLRRAGPGRVHLETSERGRHAQERPRVVRWRAMCVCVCVSSPSLSLKLSVLKVGWLCRTIQTEGRGLLAYAGRGEARALGHALVLSGATTPALASALSSSALTTSRPLRSQSCHGKGPSDSEGAVVKTALTRCACTPFSPCVCVCDRRGGLLACRR